jgi:asparagine synthase (glutamine-hydrolysing)
LIAAVASRTYRQGHRRCGSNGWMCGIFGALGHILPEEPVARILDVLDHRGPDGRGVWIDEPAQITFVHTRLAVIDLLTGDQPLHSQDGNVTLICNGEIYGFEAIRSSLESKGHRFSTKSDSEVIIGLYEEYGLDFLEHLRGEFAFLLYDRAKRRFIAARDRFGIKPLYFSRLPRGFVFASEMKAIFASGLVEPKLDVAALDPILNQHPERMLFPFEGIEHIPPASCLVVDLDTQESALTRYWSPEIPAEAADPVPQPFGSAPERCARIVLEELEEAVRLRLRADVPVGLYLSGGLDSVFIGMLMKRNLNARFHSFSIAFVGSQKNEEEFARRASVLMDSDHHELAVTKAMLWDNLEDCLWSTELPFVSLAPVGKFLLSKAAREHVTVVLNGQGADEVFLGYRAFFRNAIRDTRRAGSSGRSDSARDRRLDLGGLRGVILRNLSLRLVHKSHRARLRSARANGRVPADTAKPLINAVQETRIAEMPVDILGFLGDRVEMAHSLEVRVPFLDHHLYDAAKAIPVDFKMRDGLEKAVLRDAAKDILPDDLRLRPKRGFMFTSDPIDFHGVDRKLIGKLGRHLSREAFEQSGIFSYGAYKMVSLLARVPEWKRIPALRRLRRTSNKIMMYMMQAHMLHDMYVANPRWAEPRPKARPTKPARALAAGPPCRQGAR